MPVPVKAVATGTIALGIGGLGIYLVYHKDMPEWHSISINNSASTTYGSDKYANSYMRYLVDADNEKKWCLMKLIF